LAIEQLGASARRSRRYVAHAESTDGTKEISMTTRETVQKYLDAVAQRSGWEDLLAEGVTFTNFAAPVKHLAGKPASLEATRRFYATVASLRVNDLLVDGERACALTHYALQMPGGAPFTSDVAEIFTVRNGRVVALAIYFDSAPYPKPPS
jgi:ketosteroid isomerase-like protein